MRFFTQKTVRAKKDHTCNSCGRTINPGETYSRGFGADGHTWTWKECVHCEALVSLWRLWDCCGDEGYGSTCFTEHYCDTITDLRWMVQWRRQWRRRDGQLYPVPTREAVAA